MVRKRQPGFTLIEMMIVIAVLTIMASIAIPNFMSLLPGMRLNGAARQVMGDLMAARMKAVKENNNYKVTFQDSTHYEIWDDDGSDGADHDSETTSDDIKNIQNEYDNVIFSSTGDPIFTPRGVIKSLSSTATITFQNTSGGCKKVKVSITGRVKIAECEDS